MPTFDHQRILITGGSGFIGRALVKTLISGGSRPLVLDRNAPEQENYGDLGIARVDLLDRPAVGILIDNFRPDLVFHLAGVNVRDDPTGSRNDETNFHSTASMLEQLSAAGTRKVVMMGTAAEYGDNPTPFREDMEPRPISHYARSKAKATAFALGLSARTGLDVTVLRTFTAYGPGQPANMFLSQLVRHALLNKRFNMSDGTQRRDFVYIDDVVNALMAASVSATTAARTINIGTGRAIKLREAAKLVWNTCRADSANLAFGSKEKVGDDKCDTLADITLASELLGWRPTISFEKGISRMITAERRSLGIDQEPDGDH